MFSPKTLLWARQRAGLSIADAADALMVSGDQLREIEMGRQSASVTLLRKMAEAYDCSLGLLHLPVPPLEERPLNDFRNVFCEDREEGRLRILIDQYRVAASILKDLLEDEHQGIRHPVIAGCLSRQDDGDPRRILFWLQMEFGLDRAFIATRTPEEILSHLRDRAEKRGIAIVFAKKPEEGPEPVFWNMTLADPVLSMLVIRGGMSVWSSLYFVIHGLCLLMMGQSALSGSIENRSHHEADRIAHKVCETLLGETGDHDGNSTTFLPEQPFGSGIMNLICRAWRTNNIRPQKIGTLLNMEWSRAVATLEEFESK